MTISKKPSGPKTPATDPHAQREADKYDNPIPSREYIQEVLGKAPGPMSHEDLCDMLDLVDEESVEALRRRLIAMERDGQLISNRRRGYACVDQLDLVRGRVQGHKDGYGFVIPAEGGDDVYLHNRQMRKVFDGDEVLVRLSGDTYRGRLEGSVVEVLVRHTHQLVGRYSCDNGIGLVRPDNPRLGHDVMIPADGVGDTQEGQFVVVEIVRQPDRRSGPVGRVMEVLGDHMAPGMEIEVAIRAHGIPNLWPGDVQTEANALPVEVDEADKAARVDLRSLPFVTIDGEDARDFDDAVYCAPQKSGGFKLYVAIADVSHYVAVGSGLDREAQVRGTSVYFPDFVVPMLPEALSNGLCSLNPKVDRLCMVCEMDITENGVVDHYRFYEGIIYSHARMTYTQVGKLLDKSAAAEAPEVGLGQKLKGFMKNLVGKAEEATDVGSLRTRFEDVIPHVEALHDLYKVLRVARDKRGAIDFETVETRILFDEDRKIERIVPTHRNDAHKLIEECMLSANVCAADFLDRHELTCLYRVHEGPGAEKLEKLREFLGELGLSLPGGEEPLPRDYQSLLQTIADRPDAQLIQTVMLRSLRQAVYQSENKGHFGLGYQAYAHFTSPIRRYPDLLVHRAIRSVVRSQKETQYVTRVDGAKPLAREAIYPYAPADILFFGENCSVTERRADEATRDVVSWLKCEYLQDHVGDVFEGVVTAVTSFGLFVELKDLYVEGLVHITALPHDFYHFEAAHHRLIGEHTRKVFRLGDGVTVQVVRVDLDNRKVDFELDGVTSTAKKPKGSGKYKKSDGDRGSDKKRGSDKNRGGDKKRGPRGGAGKNKPKGAGKAGKSASAKAPSAKAKKSPSERKPRK